VWFLGVVAVEREDAVSVMTVDADCSGSSESVDLVAMYTAEHMLAFVLPTEESF
jgi:hypothetical protein